MRVESKNHNQIFSELQKKYLQDRDKDTLGKMYLIMKDYACNVILQYIHKKHISFRDEVILQKAHDMSTVVVERYLVDPDFKIEKLTAYMHFPFLKVMFGGSDAKFEQMESSLDEILEAQQGRNEKNQ